MGSTNSLPVVSQAKSGVQLICGDVDGAAQTQRDFLQECPGVSQLLAGDVDGAIETQKKCGKGVLNVLDGTPVVGHAKGVLHYAFGDAEGGNRAMKSASRTTGVIAGGAGGFLVGGPVGAVAGGIGGGAAMDMLTTGIDSAVHDEFRPNGYFAAIDNMVKNPSAGNAFDLAFMPVADGMAGYSAGKLVRQFQKPKNIPLDEKPPIIDKAKGEAMMNQAQEAMMTLEENKHTLTSAEYNTQAKAHMNMFNEGQRLAGEGVRSMGETITKAHTKAGPRFNVATTVGETAEVVVYETVVTEDSEGTTQKTYVRKTEGTEEVILEHDDLETECEATKTIKEILQKTCEREEFIRELKQEIRNQSGYSYDYVTDIVDTINEVGMESVSAKLICLLSFCLGEELFVEKSNDTDDSDDDDDDCTCKKIKLKVLYFNAQSIKGSRRNPKMTFKFERILRYIVLHNPNIIAINETWLNELESEDNWLVDFLIMAQYSVERRDAVGDYVDPNDAPQRRGLLVAFRSPESRFAFRRTPLWGNSELETLDDKDLMSFEGEYRYQCRSCKRGGISDSFTFGFMLGYKPHHLSSHEDQILRETFIRHCRYFCETKNGFAFVADFNYRNKSMSQMGFNDYYHTNFPCTHVRGGGLDQIIYYDANFVSDARVGSRISDHHALIFNLNFGKDYHQTDVCRSRNCKV